MSLKQLLWLDAVAGGVTALVGLLTYRQLAVWLGLPPQLLLATALANAAYGACAGSLARQADPGHEGLRSLVRANWLWTIVSLVMLGVYRNQVTPLGLAFLVLQPLVVGGLAWLEGRHLKARF